MHGASRRTAPAASSAGNTSDPEEPSTTQFNLAPMRTSLFTRPRTHPLPLSSRLWLIITTYLPLGFISFGGPGVHVVLLRQRFVDELKWIDLRTFLDLFALGNALPGPGSTQIAFAIATVTHGVLPGLIAFLFWSLPGAVGMTLLGAGVGQIPAQLHPAVLATLSGLNAAAVGLIALSAEQLAKASATDEITLAIVWLSASAGICYHAPWMYPTLIVAGGSATLVWDFRRTWGRPIMRMWKALSGAGKDRQGRADEGVEGDGVEMHRQDSGIGHQASTSPVAAAAVAAERIEADGGGGERDGNAIPLETPASNYTAGTFASTAPLRDSTPSRTTSRGEVSPPRTDNSTAQPAETDDTDTAAPSDPLRVVPFGVSYALIGAFVLVLAVPLAIRGGLSSAGKAVPRALSLFVNFTLAGTLIFGGGPVVVPMLRDYVVAPGWVSNRDFLLIFAILQAFPGPNFNFSLALGFLALSSLPSPSLSQSIGGSLLGYIGIFLPGLLLMLAFLPIYSIFRLHPIARATIRGLNAAATGLVWVAVWQLFLVGHIYVGATGTTGGTEGETRALSGPLTADPWWAVVASGSFLACRNYGLPPWAGVLGGGAAGALWYAATRS